MATGSRVSAAAREPLSTSPVVAVPAATPRPSAGPWRAAWRRLRRHRLAMIGLVVIVVLTLMAVFAGLLAPYPFAQQNTAIARQGPTTAHWLGTDELGRDMLSRLMHGARISLAVGIVAQLLILAIGVPLGAAAGYFGGWVDMLVSRTMDVLYSFPDLLLIIIVTTSLKAAMKSEEGGIFGLLAALDAALGGLLGVFIALGLVSWLTVARLVRAQVLSLKQKEFVEAAHAAGAGNDRIIGRHLLPNTLGVIVVAATFGIPRAIIVEAALSFIGLGVQPPMTSWGAMILTGANAARGGVPHLLLVPAAALTLVVLAFNFLGDGLRDALDPWTRT